MYIYFFKVVVVVKLVLVMVCLYVFVIQVVQFDNDIIDNLFSFVEVIGLCIVSVVWELFIGILILDCDVICVMFVNNLVDVLDILGGVQVCCNFGINGVCVIIDMQGFGVSVIFNILVLFNGCCYSNVDLFGLDIVLILLVVIECIEVLFGVGVVLYGNGVVGGVVNIVICDCYENQVGVEVIGGSFSIIGGSLWVIGYYQGEGGGDYYISVVVLVQVLYSDGYWENNDLQQCNVFVDLCICCDDFIFYLIVIGE